jgi:hypothetical protein
MNVQDLWWATASEVLRSTLCVMLADIQADAAVLLLATADEPMQARRVTRVASRKGAKINCAVPSRAAA